MNVCSFPSLESHMSVVVLGHLVVSGSAPFLLFPPALAVAGLVGFSRVYARSRFAHQIIGSWLTGLCGLFIGLSLCTKFNFDRYVCITQDDIGF
jgi:membrane-associated phospholipid phosphatase